MSFLDRIAVCHAWDPAGYRPFVIDNGAAPAVFGFVAHDFARTLADFPDVFKVDGRAVALAPHLRDFEARSAAVDAVVHRLVERGDLPKYRGESYGVQQRWGDPPVMRLDRGAVPLFGTRGFGVHVNGLVEGDDGLSMWVGKRALDKANSPGKLDHLVAGGQPYGLSILDNLKKEAEEEAGLPAELIRLARPVGMIAYRCARPEGLRDDVIFCFDLQLPENFTPRNLDGEVDHFMLWPIARVVATVRDSDDFKFNCNLVILHLLVRRGLLGPDDPDYQRIVEGFSLRDA